MSLKKRLLVIVFSFVVVALAFVIWWWSNVIAYYSPDGFVLEPEASTTQLVDRLVFGEVRVGVAYSTIMLYPHAGGEYLFVRGRLTTDTPPRIATIPHWERFTMLKIKTPFPPGLEDFKYDQAAHTQTFARGLDWLLLLGQDGVRDTEFLAHVFVGQGYGVSGKDLLRQAVWRRKGKDL